jgi:C-terminal processing protease CtpA/Prc
MPAAARRRFALPIPAERGWHELKREKNLAVLRVDRFDYGNEADQWEPYVTKAFRDLARDGVRALIVDLRENEGGSDEGALLLLRHLIRTPIARPALRQYVTYDTVSSALRPHLKTWDKSFYDRRGSVTSRADGTFDLNDSSDWPTIITPAADAFAGHVYVLTSYVNSSASHILLRLLARQPGVTLVGDPTGGSLRAHTGGNLFFLHLPHIGMEVDLPLIAYDWGASNPSGGVQPDIRVPARRALEVARGMAR